MTLVRGVRVGPYEIRSLVATGGMGEVYRARDTRLEREVALKVLSPRLTEEPQALARFEREAKAVAALSHPNILALHDFDSDAGTTYAVTELLEGQTLRERLKGGPLSLREAVTIAAQIAEGLGAAHDKGIVHRDLKPDNLFLTRGDRVKILDFGLARFQPLPGVSGDESDSPTVSHQTEPGTVLGTLDYMSPEQVRGQPADHRSDIFSFGAILYEMLAGRRAFQAGSPADTMSAILRDDPPALRESGRVVPPPLDGVVRRCLEKLPERRYQSIHDVAHDLETAGVESARRASAAFEWGRRWLVNVAALAALLALGAAAVLAARWFGTARLDARTVLVLPFEVRGEGAGADYVGRAFAEAVAVNLAQADGIKVLPVPAQGLVADADAQAPARAGRSAKAGRVVSGSVMRTDSDLEASLSLTDVADNRLLWGTQSKSGRGDDLTAVAAGLAREVATLLGGTAPAQYDHPWNLTGGQGMADAAETAAVRDALRSADLPAALAASERLVAAFPLEHDAHALRAFVLFMQWYRDRSSERRRALEETLAVVTRLDPKSPYGDILRGMLASESGDLADTRDRLTRVLRRTDIGPALRGYVLRYRSMAEQGPSATASALADLEEARRLAPMDHMVLFRKGSVLHRAGRLEEALVTARQVVALEPRDWGAHTLQAAILSMMGRQTEAAEAYARACALSQAQEPCAASAAALQHAGRPSEARRAAEAAAALPESPFGAYNLACYYAQSAEPRRAVDLLRRALDLGFADEVFLRDAELDSLRGRPDFKALQKEVERRLGRSGSEAARRE